MKMSLLVAASMLALSACGSYPHYEEVRKAATQAKSPPHKHAPAPATQVAQAAPVSAPSPVPATPTAEGLPPADAPLFVRPAPVITEIPGGSVEVAKGETLFAISRRSGADVTDLISANNLEAPYAIRAGQKLIIPPLRYHRVEAGETASSIARRYDVTLIDIVRLNNLEPPYSVTAGRNIKLPSDSMMPVAPPVKTPAPAPAVIASVPPPVAKPPAPALPAPPVSSPAPAPAPAPTPVPSPSPAPEPPAPQPAAAQSSEAPRFAWPVRGRILYGFGDLGGGRFNDGVNIATTKGAPVKVAADGVVLFAEPMRGFGNLLLIRHAGNWLSAYGHNSELLVQRGTSVRRGEIIARAGQSGNVTSPQLHFEIRRGSKPVNPLPYLSASQ